MSSLFFFAIICIMDKEKLKHFDTAIVFSCGTCNLNCRYCGIDKNPALLDVDKVLEESFKGDYYFNKIKKYYPDPKQLKRLEIWGGETMYKVERIFPLLDSIVKDYPAYEEFFASTNFSYPEWTDKILSLINKFKTFNSLRRFRLEIQLSIDGPQYINDDNRGVGVTKRCLDNFNKLVDIFKDFDLPKNIQVALCLKQTLDIDSIKKLQTKEAIIEYYKFFEDNFIDKIRALNKDNITMANGLPNTAVPSPITKENGKEFANLCKLSWEIQQENKETPCFKYYRNIMPFSGYGCSIPKKEEDFRAGPKGCGTGFTSVSFLPNDLLCICHLGYMEFIDEYKKYNAQSKKDKKVISFDKFAKDTKFNTCLKEERYEKFMDSISLCANENSTCRLCNMHSIITILALSHQIDEKYLDQEEAAKAARKISQCTAYCINDALNVTGSITTQPIGIFKQLLNGAIDYIELGDKDCNESN